MSSSRKGKCIYCSRKDIVLTDSHILTAAFGTDFVLEESVCKECQKRAKAFEEPVLNACRFLRVILKLEGRRGIPGLAADVLFRGKKKRVTLGPNLKPLSGSTVLFKSESWVCIFATDKKIGLRRKLEYETAHPDAHLKPLPLEILGEGPEMRISMDWGAFVTVGARRFAAKVAFESYVKKCGVAVAYSNEYEGIKQFILHGTERDNCLANIFVAPSTEQLVMDVGFPHHRIFVQSTKGHELLAIVSLFSLLHYWVRLSKTHSGIESATCYVVNPQNGYAKEPKLYGPNIELLDVKRVAPPIPWRKMKSWYTRNDPARAIDYAAGRLNMEIKRALAKKEDSAPQHT
ncbi:hypothetical protein E3J62_01295 [candidate division TA06 bacterium]|uniref:HNH endonuclease 5 domain-containing protein n=1 Tax=candidate division TA06 bacterium TaxID=2250710 RepID=A0A523UYB2_UNCT6|nr:MAG: hypothetical protein E3J62_01295 [candidate division TA06 bacterium]